MDIKQNLEQKIRNDYKGLISDEQIEATIKWWNDLLDLAIAERDKEIVEMIEEECPSSSGLTAFIHKDKIINLITNSKNNMNLEQIIKKQEESWDSKVYAIPYASRKHKKDIREILEGVVEREKENIKELDFEVSGEMDDFVGRIEDYRFGYNESKQDTINYLSEIIKKL